MRKSTALTLSPSRLITLLTLLAAFASAATATAASYENGPSTRDDLSGVTTVPAEMINVGWNVNESGAPLLSFPEDRINSALDQALTYKLDHFRFRIFQPLSYDEERARYLLPTLAETGPETHFIEFALLSARTYVSTDGSNIRLVDNDTMKTISTSDGAKYIFVRHPDGEFRCVLIKEPSGATLNLLYTANGMILHGLRDGAGRIVTFDYDSAGIKSVTQSWMAQLQGFTRTWSVKPLKSVEAKAEYSHAVSLKVLPANAIVRQYSSEMAASDELLAQIFGGTNAVAAGNGFEPAGLAMTYPLYRGDVLGDDGIKRRGHLSFAMHLYGRADGTGDSPIFVPAGFTSHSAQPTPTDAAVTFYYPKLGNQSDVTLAVFHVADFQITNEGQRIRIGNLGGPGGSSPLYKHSHIEFYRGNTGLPSPAERSHLRIDPAKIFTAGTGAK